MLQPRPGMPSLSLLPEMAMHFPAFHPPQPGLIQACLPGTSAETLRRPINLQSPIPLGFKEHTSQVKFIHYLTCSFHLKNILHYDFLNYLQVSSVWEDELHNVVHMGFNSSPHNTQDSSGTTIILITHFSQPI